MWSVGCILMELYIGTPLLYCNEVPQLIEKMWQVIGNV